MRFALGHLAGLTLAAAAGTVATAQAADIQNQPTALFEGLFSPDGGRRPVMPTPPSFRFIPTYSVQEAGTPIVVRWVAPSYTSDAMKVRVEGKVTVRAIVRQDGTVGEVQVARSLDAVHGLDDSAIKAAKQWLFTPVLKDGMPVQVRVEMTFAFVCHFKQ